MCMFQLGGDHLAFQFAAVSMAVPPKWVWRFEKILAAKTMHAVSISGLVYTLYTLFLLGPTKCEVERFTATRFGHPFIPSCHRNGDYQTMQCHKEGLCWCADTQGKEIHGTRQKGEPPSCGGFPLKGFLFPSRQVMFPGLFLQTSCCRTY